MALTQCNGENVFRLSTGTCVDFKSSCADTSSDKCREVMAYCNQCPSRSMTALSDMKVAKFIQDSGMTDTCKALQINLVLLVIIIIILVGILAIIIFILIKMLQSKDRRSSRSEEDIKLTENPRYNDDHHAELVDKLNDLKTKLDKQAEETETLKKSIPEINAAELDGKLVKIQSNIEAIIGLMKRIQNNAQKVKTAKPGEGSG